MALCAVLLCSLALPAQATFRLYLAPDGRDDRDGRSEATAIRSLARADELLHRYDPQDEVEVLIAPGTYYRQQVSWTYLNGRRISFRPTPGATARPVFDGRGEGTWFQHRSIGESKLDFRYLTVTRYWLGLDLGGDWTDPDRWNGGNEVRGMRFLRIGSRYLQPPQPYSYAALRLGNSRSNLIVGNHFEYIENLDEHSGFIHAIYAAHYSSANRIEGNRFFRVNGDAVRTRDAADGNVLVGNTFDRAGKQAAYSDWYVPPERQPSQPECPSVLNRFDDNRVLGGYYGSMRTTWAFGDDDACGPSGDPRIVESGTVSN